MMHTPAAVGALGLAYVGRLADRRDVIFGSSDTCWVHRVPSLVGIRVCVPFRTTGADPVPPHRLWGTFPLAACKAVDEKHAGGASGGSIPSSPSGSRTPAQTGASNCFGWVAIDLATTGHGGWP